jgi:hypothetical protein
MPRINPQILIEHLEGLHTMLKICWELSKNQELTDLLDQTIEKLEKLVDTLERAFPG